MADQLLSQSDVDALVSSLMSNKPAAKPAASAPPSPPPPSPAPQNAAPPASKPPAAESTVKMSAPTPKAATPAVVQAQSVPAAKTASAASQSPAPKATPVSKQEPKTDASAENVKAMNAKLAELTNKISQMEAITKRLESMEHKIAVMEAKLVRGKESPAVAKQVNQLGQELKRLALNLQGTPGYAIKHNFKCDKCHDGGHVATLFRCTKCGHESWRGWWPEK